MDMVRKYLRMGFIRVMRHAKYPDGRKYDDGDDELEPETWADLDKRKVAEIFKEAWDEVREHPDLGARESFEA
jgi:hypothetical protein